MEKIPVCGAKQVRFAEDGCLQNNNVVYVPDGGSEYRVQRNYLGTLPQELDEIVYLRFRQAVDSHQTRVAQDRGEFMEHFVRED